MDRYTILIYAGPDRKYLIWLVGGDLEVAKWYGSGRIISDRMISLYITIDLGKIIKNLNVYSS
jgi:hypothetical protein